MRLSSARVTGACVRLALLATLTTFSSAAVGTQAQAPATADGTATVRSVGTVKSVSAGTLSLGTDKGETVAVSLPANVRILQLAPGSTDLKTAQPGTLSDINQGDRILVTGKAGEGGAVTALRVILMKSGAIAQNNVARQQDWQRRGSGGVVDAVDPAAHSLTLTSGSRKVTVTTTPATVFRRYAPGSVRFEDATISNLGSIQPGDQARVRGDKSADGTSVSAEEVVSGAFRNVAGLITRVDAGAGTLTLNDLATKKPVTVTVAADSDLRALPPEMAARFAAHARGGAAAGSASSAASGATPAAVSSRPPAMESASASTGEGNGGGAHHGGGDLSQAITRMPKAQLADLKSGEAVMVVASANGADSSALTVITLLSGVEPLLASSKGGASSFNLSPWSLGGEGSEGAAQ